MEPVSICVQAGLFLWQQLLPKKADAAREELLKLDIAGVSVTLIAATLIFSISTKAGTSASFV